jgi:hypothetical protein
MKEIVAGVEVASAFPGSISQGPARSIPYPSYHLINPPTPPLFIFKTLQIISERFWKLGISGSPKPAVALSKQDQPQVLRLPLLRFSC